MREGPRNSEHEDYSVLGPTLIGSILDLKK